MEKLVQSPVPDICGPTSTSTPQVIEIDEFGFSKHYIIIFMIVTNGNGKGYYGCT